MTVSLEKTTRPLIRFDDADVDRSTARRYANDLISRVNKPETNEILGRVAEGERVDAYDLAEALLDAQRHIATRFGQSMQRRREGEKAAHLGYIAHSVLKNHADGLPVYEPGARSRRVETLEGEVAALSAAGRDALRTIKEQSARLDENTAALAEATAKLSSVTQVAQEAVKGRDQFASALDYALDMLTPCQKQRVFGFLDGRS